MFRFVRTWRAKRLRPKIDGQKAFYEQAWTPEAIRAWQLDRFNERWASMQRDVPYFARLREQGDVPAAFSSWEQFRATMPVMNRKTVQQHGEALTSTERGPDFHRVTGGSTAEPIQLPAWSSEHAYARRDFWYARAWYDITPADRLFLLWGHSHLFGEGLRGWWNKAKRQIKDRVLGYHRFSAYDLGEASLREAGDALLRQRPAYVLGYSTALDRFAQVNADRKNQFHQLDLKAVIATSESFPRADSPQLVSEVLGAPVTMEYGTVETGPIAYQAPDGRYRVFWRHYLLEGKKTDLLDDAYELLVTSLYPRCFPLMRYRVGDVVPDDVDAPSFDQTLSAITGRCNDYIALPDGRRIHSETFTHVVKDLDAIRAYQVRQQGNHDLTLSYVTGNGDLGDEKKRRIRRRLGRVDPALKNIQMRKVSSLERTSEGKTKRVVRE